MKQNFSLKDHLFNKTKITKIAAEISHAYPRFQKQKFIKETTAKFSKLELKQRISWIAESFRKYLPEDYQKALAVLVKSLPTPCHPKLSDNDFGDFIYAPYAEFVAKYGCSKKHLNISLSALQKITQRCSAEDAIRYFINAFPVETLKTLLKWSKDSHYHIRRLCSEGTRPRLPWAQKINIAIDTPLPILDQLFYDKTRFVTRSVANHLNDIAKVDAKLAISTLKRWQKSAKQKSQEMNFILRHALRTLVKNGNPEAIEMLGFSYGTKVTLTKFVVPKKIKMNTKLMFSFNLKAAKDTAAIVDYLIYFQSRSGDFKNKKVFKLKQIKLEKNKEMLISKNHMFKQFMTTRTLYAGRHELAVQVNGKVLAREIFWLGE